MLETIRKDISELDDIPFDKYFLQYVMKVQDSMIAKELEYMIKYNVVDIKLVDRAISDAVKELSNRL